MITKKLYCVFGLLLAALAIFQVFILNKFSTYGNRLTAVNAQIKEKETENSMLVQKIASSSALVNLVLKKEEVGLSASIRSLSLAQPVKVARLSNFSL